MASPKCDGVHKEYENDCSNFEDGVRQPSRWGSKESDENFDDYIRKPEEFGEHNEDEKSKRSERADNDPGFEDRIRQPKLWVNRESDSEPPEFENPKETCNSGEGNFDDHNRQPDTWGASAEVTNFVGNRNTEDSGENLESRDRIIFPDDELLKNTENNTEVEPKGEDDGKIVFPDD